MISLPIAWPAWVLAIWNKMTVQMLWIITAVISLFIWRYRIRKKALQEFQNKMQGQVYDQIRRSNGAAARAAGVSTDEWLRKNGYLRE